MLLSAFSIKEKAHSLVWPHRVACAREGVLGRKGFALVNAARICPEACRRVGTNCMMRDLDLPVLATDSRRLEVVVDGLPLIGGANWLSTPPWCVPCIAMVLNLIANRDAWFSKQRTDVRGVPRIGGSSESGPLVVLAIVGGRWTAENQVISGPTSQGKVSQGQETPLLQKHAEQVWRLRWEAFSLEDARLRPIPEIGRSRNWPKSNSWCLLKNSTSQNWPKSIDIGRNRTGRSRNWPKSTALFSLVSQHFGSSHLCSNVCCSRAGDRFGF